jgi:HK97 family phage major capsid protein
VDPENEKKTPQEWRQYTHSQAVARLKDVFDELERLQQKGERSPLDARDAERFAELTVEFEAVDEHRQALERKAATERLRVTREGLRSAAMDALRRDQVDRGGEDRAGRPGLALGDYDADPILEPDSVEHSRFRNPWDLSEVRSFGRSPDEVGRELRARALSAIEKMPGASDKVRAAATVIVETWDDKRSTLAQQVLVTSSPLYMRAWTKVLAGRSNALEAEERAILDRAMSLSDADGGYLVPFQLDPTVIITSTGVTSGIRAIARQVVATGDVWHGVSASAGSWSWDQEGEEVSDDSPDLAQPEIPNYKGSGFIPASIESLQDMANGTAEIARILAFGKMTLEGSAFAVGSGVKQPTGIVTALTGTTSVVTSTTTDTFAAADVYKLEGELPERYQEGASFLAHRKIYNLVRQFDTSGGAQMWERIGNGMPPELLGQGAYRNEAMDSVINAGAENYVMAYGDFSNYVITDRIGMAIELIGHLFGTNGRPTGERGFYAYYRTGSDSVNDGAFRMLNVT